MKKTVTPVAEASALEEELPVRVREALGELAAAAREGCWPCRSVSASASSLN
jgi:hypothetical protein